MNKQHLRPLTSVRFLAALAVLMLHFGRVSSVEPHGRFMGLAQHGRAGVSFFFILSGFILTFNYREWFRKGVPAAAFKRFAQARFARVYPMHLVVLVAITPVFLWVLSVDDVLWVKAADVHRSHLVPSWIANLLLLQVYVPSITYQKLWNLPAWSVACEAFFYATFPFFVAWVMERFRTLGGLLWLAATCWFVQVVVLLGARFVVFRHHSGGEAYEILDELVYKMPFGRVFEFFIGCCAGEIFLLCRPKILDDRGGRDGLLALGLFGVLGVIAATMKHLPLTEVLYWYALYTPFFALIIVVLGSGPTFLSWLLERPIMILLGEASYSLYMIHWIAILILNHLSDLDHPNAKAKALSIGAAVLCVAVSVLCLKWIETPARTFLRSGEKRPVRGPMAEHGPVVLGRD